MGELLHLSGLNMEPLEAVIVLISVVLLLAGILVGGVVLASKPFANIVTLEGEEAFYDPQTGGGGCF